MDGIFNILLDFVLGLYGPYPYILVFCILLACGLGLPIPEDITLALGGIAAWYGICNLWVMIVVSFAGVMIGDSLIFYLGSHYGRKLTKKWIFHKLLPDDRLNAVRKKLDEGGNRILFAARFMPGLRAPVYFSAGTLHVPFKIFLLYDGLAALISVPAIIMVVYYFGDELHEVILQIRKAEHGILIVIVGVLAFIGLKWWMSHRKLKRNSVVNKI